MRLPDTLRPLAHGVVDLVAGPIGSIKGANTEDLVVSLTFDDGPHPRHTPAILDVLSGFGARATFFFTAQRAAEHQELARKVRDEGHEVGLHSIDHLPLPLLRFGAVWDRVRNGRRMLEDVIEQDVRLFRPPYGDQTLATYLLTRAAGMQVVGWTATCQDWERLPPEEIARRAIERLQPGGILLLHDYVEPDVLQPVPLPDFDRAQLVERILIDLSAKGFETVGVTDLITRWPERRTLWFWWREKERRRREARLTLQ